MLEQSNVGQKRICCPSEGRILPLLFFLTSLAPPSFPQKKEKSESERLLTEQLQAKEWELLQLKTEMETSQGTGSAHRISITQNNVYLSDCCVCMHMSLSTESYNENVFACVTRAHFCIIQSGQQMKLCFRSVLER